METPRYGTKGLGSEQTEERGRNGEARFPEHLRSLLLTVPCMLCLWELSADSDSLHSPWLWRKVLGDRRPRKHM